MTPYVVVESNCEKDCPICGQERIGGEKFESGLNHIGIHHKLQLQHVGPFRSTHQIAAVFGPSLSQRNHNAAEEALKHIEEERQAEAMSK